MSGGTDLTRWNRAGLSRFRYVDGNAAMYLEKLRSALAERFTKPRWLRLHETEFPPDERLLAQYRGERGDWGWEIARALARACHVLTEHLDSYANEGYLGTATQWENVRRLVEMLDYHPAPQASASTPLVIVAKGEPGTVERGFQIKHSPPGGGAPAIFETLEDLEVDPALNTLRLAGWNRSPETFLKSIAALERPLEKLRATAIQGLGEDTAYHLDAFKKAATGDASATFTVGDFLPLEPARGPVQLSRVWLWEYKSKAEEVLGFPWSAAALAPLLDRTLPQVLATSPGILARETGQPEADMQDLLRVLRRVQIALDEPVINVLRLRDLVGGGRPMPSSPWIAPDGSGISGGQVGIMVRDSDPAEAAVVLIDNTDPGSGAITLKDPPLQPPWRSWTKGETSLLIKPHFIERPRLNGRKVVAFEEAHNLSVGVTVAWQDEKNQWMFDSVVEADDQAVRLRGKARPPLAAEVFRALTIERGKDGLLFPHTYRAAAQLTASGFALLTENDSEVIEPKEGTPIPRAKYRRLKPEYDYVQAIVLVPQDVQPAGRVASFRSGEYIFDGKPGKLSSGQWVVADDGARFWPLRIARIIETENGYSVIFAAAARPAPPVTWKSLEVIQGVGVGGERSRALQDKKINTVGDLAKPEVLDLEITISPIQLWELVTKARMLLGFHGDLVELAPILSWTLDKIVAKTDDALAEELSIPEASVAELKDQLRSIEYCLDAPAFRILSLGDLLPPTTGPERVARIYALFEYTLRPEGYDYNPTPLAGSRISLELADLPRLLSRGRGLVIEKQERDGTRSNALQARVLAVHPQQRAIDIDPPIRADNGFTVGATVLSGNVIIAGHGETRPERVLGSGDVTSSGETLVLKERGISFVADPTLPTGVRADIEVKVDGQAWHQVGNIRESGPADPHYAVRMTEDGFLGIQFGDGRHGRRLPTGGNNVRGSFRVGTGLAGNLPAGSLAKPIKPHPLVESVRQPLDATGGNDMEPVQSLRKNAPASILTLDRAVSLDDFASLAARHASVWQARAFSLPTGLSRHDSVEVVVVPAEGGSLGDLDEILRKFLQSHAVPGVEIRRVSKAELLAIDLAVTARIKSAEYDPEKVLGSIKSALLEAFSLRRRMLGQDLFLSAIYQVVEAVRGVENSLCVLDGDAGLRRKKTSERQVFYLDPMRSALTVKYEEFRL